MSEWFIYRRGEAGEIARLPTPPPWRTFGDIVEEPAARDRAGWLSKDERQASEYRPQEEVLGPVNAALYLRRPLLVTGRPGVGKSTLAYSVAYKLGLGPVLYWPISSSSVAKDGLYRYDAIGRLQDINMQEPQTDIGRYLRLGPLGTALLPSGTPRALLIDEIDKANIDLPNDLLGIFERGEYEIPELVRIADRHPSVTVRTADHEAKSVEISGGSVRCIQFPFVVMTSNGEREFPEAFLRRCLRLDIKQPGPAELAAIVEARLGADVSRSAGEMISSYHRRAQRGPLATDQLLNTLHLFRAISLTCRNDLEPTEREQLEKLLLQHLDAAQA